jgi:flagellar hook protein FlgE
MSFQQGLSGLNASSSNLEVIGNNIANSSTYGAKASRAEFSDMYANALSGAGKFSIGIGVTVTTVAQQFSQGAINATDNGMDLAINGNGFFQLSDEKNPPVYTRNGQFKVDDSGYIVNNDGLKLLGYPADDQGTIQPGTSVPLQLPTGGINPNQTTRVDMEVNLNSGEGVITDAMDFADGDSYNDAVSQTVYDVKGQPVALTYYFKKTGTDTWDVYARANGTTLAGTEEVPLPITSLSFSANGTTPTPASISMNIPQSTNSAGALTEAIAGVNLDFGDTTQYGSKFATTDLSQDGYAPGTLSGIVFEKNGIVTARYSNGQSKSAGQLELATFRNLQGLQPVGGNNWLPTYMSGDPIVGVPTSGNIGTLQAGALEESNVDLTSELVNMITAQRNYQANAQTIKTMDQVMQTLVNLR